MASKAGVGIPKKKQEVSIPKMPDKKSNKEEVGIPKMPKKRSDKQEKPKKRKGRRPLPCPVGKKRNAQGKCVKSRSGNKSPKKGVRKPNKKANAACMAKANAMIRRGQALKRRCSSRPRIQK